MAAKMPRLNAKRGGNGNVSYRAVTSLSVSRY